MTSGVCPHCGAPAGHGRFCPKCGGALLLVCASCGTENAGGNRFCRTCGRPLTEAAASAAPAAAVRSQRSPSRKPVVIAGGAVAAVIVGLVAVFALQGEDEALETSAPQQASTQVSANTAATPRPGATATQGAPAVAPTRITPIPIAVTPGAPGTNLGSRDDATSKAVMDAMVATRLDISGLEAHVFEIIGTDRKLLVLEVDNVKAAPLEKMTSAQQTQLMQAFVIPAVKNAKVSRVAFNLNGTDAQGPYVATLTMPLTTVEQAIQNPNSTQLISQVQLQMKRGR